jgi:menaquinone-dependent protoporphyrinogen IX oxidase
MKIAIIYFKSSHSSKMTELSKYLANGLINKGNQVDIIDGNKEIGKKLSIYKFIIIGAENKSLFGGIDINKIKNFLSNAGLVNGKNSFAFINQSLFRSNKFLQILMKRMEKEGMFITVSEIIKNNKHALEIAKNLILD